MGGFEGDLGEFHNQDDQIPLMVTCQDMTY